MKFLGYGKYLPKKVLDNESLTNLVDTSDEWIVQRTGIKERRIAEENTSDLAYYAALEALENANIPKEDIDLIICATSTPDNNLPSTACLVQKKLGLTNNVTAFDVNAACTGFIYALKIASGLLATFHKKALVIGCEVMSKIIDYKDRSTCILFGDGAGAVVVEKNEKVLPFYIETTGNDDHLISKGIELNTKLENKAVLGDFLYMNGTEVFKFALDVLEKSIKKILEKENLKLEDIKLFIPHQANIRMITHIARKLKLPLEKFFINIDKYGNTSAASIPIALCEAIKSKNLQKGDKVLLVGFGAGLTWGSTIIEI